MGKKYFVVDQGFFRSDDLREIILKDKWCRFILTDSALVEMCKSKERESTLTRSLNILSLYPTRTHMSISISEALSYELINKRSISGQFLNKKYSVFIRGILSDLLNNKPSVNMAKILEEFIPEPNHLENKNQLIVLIEATKSTLADEIIKRLRNKSLTEEDKLTIIKDESPKLLQHFFQEAKFSKEKARVFLKSKPLSLRWVYLNLWSCMDWVAEGGVENLHVSKATNESLDQDYILVATFFSGLLSKDSDMNRAYHDITWILSQK